MKITAIWDAARPSATPGKVFTSDIAPEQLNIEGKKLDMLMLGLKGAVSTAAVAVEDFVGVLSEFVVKVGGAERIKASLNDLIVLSLATYGGFLHIGENTDNTGTNFVGGVKIPIYSQIESGKPITVSAARMAVTNISSETLGLTGYTDHNAKLLKPIHFVKVAHTTAGAAGYEVLGAQVAPMGIMKKLIIKNANHFSDANIDISVQRVNILVDGVLTHELNTLTDAVPLVSVDYVTPLPIADLVRNYAVFDFGEEGIDVKNKRVTLQFDVQDASDAVSWIPVIEMA